MTNCYLEGDCCARDGKMFHNAHKTLLLWPVADERQEQL